MREPFKVFCKLGLMMAVILLGVWPIITVFGAPQYDQATQVRGILSLTIGSLVIGFLFSMLSKLSDADSNRLANLVSFATNSYSGLSLLCFEYTLVAVSFIEVAARLSGQTGLAMISMELKIILTLAFAIPTFLKRINQEGPRGPQTLPVSRKMSNTNTNSKPTYTERIQ